MRLGNPDKFPGAFAKYKFEDYVENSVRLARAAVWGVKEGDIDKQTEQFQCFIRIYEDAYNRAATRINAARANPCKMNGSALSACANVVDAEEWDDFQKRLPTWATARGSLVSAARELLDVDWPKLLKRLGPTWATAGGSLVFAARDETAFAQVKLRLGESLHKACDSLISAARELSQTG
jgi:hypothetical protein